MTRYVKAGVLTGVEFVYIVLLWMCFVSKLDKQEFFVGLAVSVIATVADAIVKARGLAKFNPKVTWLLFIFLEPWYALEGTWLALTAVARKLAGGKSRSRFKVSPYIGVGNDARSAAKRTLAVTYVTLTPNSIVVGIDKQQKQVLLHELEPSSTPLIAKKLGARE